LAAALDAGVPTVVVPQLFDQVWHGDRVKRLGVGTMVMRAKKVARSVHRIDADDGVRERALTLAAAMAGEDGAGALADAVEATIAR
jgi:UDP:flavonoid glycosyltransferase YjiC (YdhE family)